MSKRKKYDPKPFENTGSRKDTFSRIYESMLQSEAWQDLTGDQKCLYLHCKARYYGEYKKPQPDDADVFTFNRHVWADLYNLYPKTNARRFTRDMTALIDHGFIDCIQKGRVTRTKNLYKFSSRWRNWQPGEEAPLAVCTESMIKSRTGAKEEGGN